MEQKNNDLRDELDKEIDEYFQKHGKINDDLVWSDSDIPKSLSDEWVWE